MRKYLFATLFLFPIFCFAQQSVPEVVASGGDYFVSASFTNSYTVGEIAVVETYSDTAFILTQGFQQPDTVLITGTVPSKSNGFSLVVFPNPVRNDLMASFKTPTDGDVILNALDVLGQVILSRQVKAFAGENTYRINTDLLANGTYFLEFNFVSTDLTEQYSQTEKIILTK